MKFRYWLNAKGVKERVGVNTLVTEMPIDDIDFKSLLPRPTPNINTNAQKSRDHGRGQGQSNQAQLPPEQTNVSYSITSVTNPR